jgi:outer membrane protein insertion porin family
MQPDTRYQLIRQPDTEGLFLNTLRNMGYAFARVQLLAEVDSSQYRARVVLALDPGPMAYINDISVEGNASVSDNLVRLESGLRQGQRYDQRRLTRAQQEIFSHHLFRFVTINLPEQPRDSTVDLNIRVRENPLRSINVQVGAGTEEYARGGVSWQHRNPFGNAHSFSASMRASFIEQRVNMDYLIPYVFNTNSSYVISPFGQRLNERNFLLYRAGATNSFVYQYSRQLAGTVSYEFTINEEVLRNRTAVLRDSTQLYNQSVLRFSGFFNEFSFDRSSGWAVRPFFEISGFLNTGTLNYQRASLDLRRFIDFSSTSQLALRIDSGVLFADDASKLPANILYYLGGTNSVRGWSRWELGPKRPSLSETGSFEGYVPIGGRVNLAFNTEFRQDLPGIARGFGLAAFFDGGQIWRSRAEVDANDLQFGVGGGFRYRSPVGPIRLDIGYKLNPTDEDLGIYKGQDFGGTLARWGIHFSIGQAF